MSPPTKPIPRIAATIAAIIASAAMIVWALPPCGFWFFGFVALVPVFWATRDTRFIYGFLAGIATSMLAAFISVQGVFYTYGKPDGEPMWTYLGFGLFGVVFAIVAGAAAEKWNRNWRYLLGMSAVAVLLEASLLWLMPAPFELSQARNTWMLEMASLTGIWGIGFLLWLFNLVCAEALVQPTLYRWFWLMSVLVFLDMSVKGPPTRPNPHYDNIVKVGAIQSDSVDLDELARLSREAGKAGAKLVVWCEFSGLAHAPGGNPAPLLKLAKDRTVPRFVTTYRDGFEPLPHNTAAIFSPLGESETYFKRKLFGSERRMHTAGTKPAVATSNSGPIGLNICYDTCFPSIIRETANLGTSIIAVPTIDPATPYDFFAACHAAFSPIRAAENGVSIIRGDGNAYSSIVGPYGETIAEARPGAGKWIVGDVPFVGHGTLYKRAGDWFLWLCAAFLAGLAVAGAWRRKASKPSSER